MRHRASRLHAVVAALLLALGAWCTAAGVASLTSTTSDSSAVSSTRHHDALTPRSPAVSSVKSGAHRPGLHLDLVAAIAALGAATLLLLGWLVARRARQLLTRFAIVPLGARAPPALV
jgi:hypothetical protein